MSTTVRTPFFRLSNYQGALFACYYTASGRARANSKDERARYRHFRTSRSYSNKWTWVSSTNWSIQHRVQISGWRSAGAERARGGIVMKRPGTGEPAPGRFFLYSCHDPQATPAPVAGAARGTGPDGTRDHG